MEIEKAIERALALRIAGESKNVVRVSLPVKVAFNLDEFQKLQRDVLGRLGHVNCTSGFDIRYDIARQFQLDDNGQLTTVGLAR